MWTLKLFLFMTTLSYVGAFSAEAPAATTTKFEVCLSPGCVADGAQETLQKLQALAPPGCLVTPGVCCSLCGNGPVVMNPNEKTITKHRRVKNQKILDLLVQQEEKDDDEEAAVVPQELIQGYDASLEADEAFHKKDFEKAAELYLTAINTGLGPAVDLQAARDKVLGTDNNIVDESGISVGLLWLIKSRRNEATARLEIKDLEGAALAAQASCDIAENKCSESLQVLAQVYEKQGNAKGELQALTDFFDLPVEKDLPMQIANQRRELGFRKAKLEREVGE